MLTGLNAGSLSGDIFINNLLNGLFEIVARVTVPFAMDWKGMGRRYSLVLMFLICASSCVISLLLKEYSDCVPIHTPNCFDDETIPPTCNQAMFDGSKFRLISFLFIFNLYISLYTCHVVNRPSVFSICGKVCSGGNVFNFIRLLRRALSHRGPSVSRWNLLVRS